MNVCDLSSNNKLMERLKAISENDAVIVKCTEGTGYRNPCMRTDIETALEQHKCIGLYHFARAENNFAIDEAMWFLRNAAPYIGKAVLILDYEGKSLSVNPVWAREFLDMVFQITGVRPMIYMSESACKTIGPAVVDRNYGLWVAKYSKNKPKVDPWNFSAMWQYTSNPYDKSVFYGDREAWKKYAERTNK